MQTDFLSTFFTFDLIFRNFKDWIHFSLQTGCLYEFPKFSKSNLGITHTESLLAGKKLSILWNFENWDQKWRMHMCSRNQFLLHLFYTTLLVIMKCGKSDILKSKQVSLEKNNFLINSFNAFSLHHRHPHAVCLLLDCN